MAKIRVYELARDLNMTNKVLVDKLQAMDLPVKSHMSTLETELIDKIKAEVLGTKPREYEYEETRVQATVIRRRRKVIRRKKVITDVPPESPEAGPAESLESAPAEPIVSDQAPMEDTDIVAEKPVIAPLDTKPAVESDDLSPPEPQPETETPAAGDTAQKTEQSDAAPAKTPDKPAAEVKTLRPVKKKKKKKKGTPAKIIQMAPPQPAKTPVEPSPRETPTKPLPPVSDIARKKGKKGKKETADESDRRFFKRKISFKRRSVVEGADLYSRKKQRRKGGRWAKKKPAATGQKTQITTAKAIKRRIKIDETIILADLAKRMGIKVSELIVQLMNMGVMATVNQSIDFDTAVLLAVEFDYEVEKAVFEEESVIKETTDDPAHLKPRPPVVTIMGHVDHGKTSLLDVIRKTRVTESEAGGITQHIGAYYVSTDNGQIVFLDTPGHEAFTAMRSRGASVTDLVILVVAADDGVMPQTQEAINHARAADVPIIVAINKIDKANADPERVQRELAETGLTPEEWGGDTIFIQVSAKMNQGINEILEMIQLQADMLELKANPDKLATGHVIEARLDTGRGPVATILVRDGTLRIGDPVVCGVHYGKIRSLLSDRGEMVKTAGPAMPVEIIGLSGVPMAGDELVALADEKDARQVSQHRGQEQRSKELAKSNRLSLDNLFEKMQEGEAKSLNIIVKADVHGSVEALGDALIKLSNEEVNIHVTHAAAGTITESDVSLAAVSNAIIIGFNVRPTLKVQTLANEEHVDMRFYNVIYDVIKDIKNAIVGMMDAVFEEHILGRAEVREVFHIPKVGAVAGCYITDGRVVRDKPVRVVRDGIVVYEGKIASVRRFKDDVKEVQNGYECGLGVEKFNDIKVEDILECYELEEIAPELT
jgi:translation initiation factor IF-2